MSRIGKKPVTIPAGVEVKIDGVNISVKGPKGELHLKVHPHMKISLSGDKVVVEKSANTQMDNELHGLTRTLINNQVVGVTKGYEKKLEIIGVGYRAQVQGTNINLSLGFSHPVLFPIPKGLQVSFDEEKKNIMIVKGIDKELLGETCARIRALKKPEPYKGKGIRYVGEYVRKKAGKSAAKGA